MLTYVIRRLLLIVPTLLGITILVFAIMAAAPGGVGASLLTAAGDMRPDWTADSQYIIFNSDRNGNWDFLLPVFHREQLRRSVESGAALVNQ